MLFINAAEKAASNTRFRFSYIEVKLIGRVYIYTPPKKWMDFLPCAYLKLWQSGIARLSARLPIPFVSSLQRSRITERSASGLGG